jgi:inositol phosphorylceramide mannosyltransferase catalytic subunit
MIDKNLFQTWRSKTAIIEHFRYWSDTVKDLNPQFNYVLWDDADNRSFIKDHYPWFLQIYDSYPVEIYRADAIRYFWLYHFGGVYLDMDSECIRPLLSLCESSTGVILGQMGSDTSFAHSIPNAVMLSSRREPFWLYVMHLMMSSQSTRKHPEDLTGSILLRSAVESFRCEAAAANVIAAIDAIRSLMPQELQPARATCSLQILPPDCFYPVNWADPIHQVYFRRKLLKDGQRLPRNKVIELFPKSYIVTYWTHSWDYPRGWETR